MSKVRVVVETPRGSNAKYAYDPDRKAFVLKHVLPQGMGFPYDFGFIPGTLADDGDPPDAVVISELATPPGIELECRIVGAIKAEQREAEADEPVRNDRVLAIPCSTRAFAKMRDLGELPPKLIGDIEDFFVHYHAVQGDRFTPLERLTAKEAERLVEKLRHG